MQEIGTRDAVTEKRSGEIQTQHECQPSDSGRNKRQLAPSRFTRKEKGCFPVAIDAALGAIRSDPLPSRVGALHAYDLFAKRVLESDSRFAPTIVSLAFDTALQTERPICGSN